MRTIEQFVETAADGKPPESSLAMAAQNAETKLDAEQLKLVKKIRVRDGKVILAEGSEAIQEQVQKVEAKAQAVKADIKIYLDALQEASSLTALTEQLARHRRTCANVKRDHEALLKQLINKGVDRPQDHPDALASGAKLDRITQELTPIIEDLQKRIDAAKSVLQRYH